MDSDSPEFAGRIHAQSADVAGGARGFDEAGSDGHGTNVAQLLLGARNDLGTVGIAWNATLLALRADRPGSCNDPTVTDPKERGCRFTDAAIAAGVDRAVSAGAKVINISLGGSTPAQILLDSVNRATAAGVIIVVSAGNNGDSTDPADDPSNPDPFAQGLLQSGNGLVIIAGSNSETGLISGFSNRAGSGANSYLLALGENVCCDYENGDLRRDVTADGSFVYVISGTSFAAPQIAGAAALLAQAFPNLTSRQIVDLLLTTATDVGGSGTDTVNGRGILNIPRAFAPQGTTSLAGTSLGLPIDRALGGLSGAMGDAALRGSAQVVVLDGYQRAYAIDLGQLIASRGAASPPLGSALAADVRSVSGQSGGVAVTLSLLPGRLDSLSTYASDFDQDAQRSRLLAGSVIARLSPRFSIGMAVDRGVDGLVSAMAGRTGDGFLVADDAAAMRRLGHQAEAGSALRWGIAPGVALTFAGERGRVAALLPERRVAETALLDRSSPYSHAAVGVDRAAWLGAGVWRTRLMASWLNERGSFLGARLSPVFGSGGAESLMLDASSEWQLPRGWQLSAQWREGWTRLDAAGLTSGGRLRSRAWAFDVARRDALVGGDRLALRFAQPLRVESGALLLDAPVGYDYATLTATQGRVVLPLAPIGRERVVEAVWTLPAFGGAVTLNSFWRDQPGHVAAASDNLGAAVRFALGF